MGISTRWSFASPHSLPKEVCHTTAVSEMPHQALPSVSVSCQSVVPAYNCAKVALKEGLTNTQLLAFIVCAIIPQVPCAKQECTIFHHAYSFIPQQGMALDGKVN